MRKLELRIFLFFTFLLFSFFFSPFFFPSLSSVCAGSPAILNQACASTILRGGRLFLSFFFFFFFFPPFPFPFFSSSFSLIPAGRQNRPVKELTVEPPFSPPSLPPFFFFPPFFLSSFVVFPFVYGFLEALRQLLLPRMVKEEVAISPPFLLPPLFSSSSPSLSTSCILSSRSY